MKKQIAILGIIILLICVGLSGCNSSTKSTPEEKILGHWLSQTYYKGKYINGSDLYYTFYTNGSCSVYTKNNGIGKWYRYEFLGQQLITTDSSGTAFIRDYSFSNDNNEVVLSSTTYPDYADFLKRQ